MSYEKFVLMYIECDTHTHTHRGREREREAQRGTAIQTHIHSDSLFEYE